ncbi:MAG: ferritin [Acholeplasmatales bacterium]|nr:ferritin [Acholeplasmatales bacterium]
MNEKVVKLLNEQIGKEFYSAYLYLGMSKYFSVNGLNGFAKWYKVQAEEEQEHAMKIYDYLLDKGYDPELNALDAVSSDYKDVLEVVTAADNHEKYITKSINDIYKVAFEEQDFAAMLFLNWFITEQEEEERNSSEMINKVKRVTKEGSLYLLDKELAERK